VFFILCKFAEEATDFWWLANCTSLLEFHRRRSDGGIDEKIYYTEGSSRQITSFYEKPASQLRYIIIRQELSMMLLAFFV
jgi:hypothetical protein